MPVAMEGRVGWSSLQSALKVPILAGVLPVGVVGENIIRYSESILFLFYIGMDSTHYEAHPI